QPKDNGAVLHPQGSLEGHQTIDNGGTLTKPKPSRLAHLGFGSPDPKDVTIDDSGAIPSSADGPSSLGQVSRLVFDKVGDDQKHWLVDNECSILVQPLPGAASTAPRPL